MEINITIGAPRHTNAAIIGAVGKYHAIRLGATAIIPKHIGKANNKSIFIVVFNKAYAFSCPLASL